MFCLIFFIFPFYRLLDGKINPGKSLKYRFEYTLQGEASGVFLLIFRYRFFFCAEASVILGAKKIDEETMQFDFEDIDKTGYLLLTWGFTGKTLITGAADYDLKKARQFLEKDFLIFKEKAPDFSRYIKRRKVFPFRIRSRGKNVITFKREVTGIHRDCSIDMQVQRIKYEKKYDFYFKIYSILLELLKIYNHSFVPGSHEKISRLEPGMEWDGPELDLSDNINRIGARATYLVEKHITFKQQRPFKLAYRVETGAPGRLVIIGEAKPQVKIWDGFKIVQVKRTIELRLSDRVVLADKFHVELLKGKGKCGFARCALTLIQ